MKIATLVRADQDSSLGQVVLSDNGHRYRVNPLTQLAV